MRTPTIYSQQFSYITYSSVSYINHVVHYIPSAYLSSNGRFVPCDHHHPVAPLPTPACGNHKSDLFFYEFVCF